MSTQPHSALRRKLKILATTAAVIVLLLAGAYGGWKVRKGIMVRSALAAGNAAYERGDWETARKMLGRYLSAHPDEPEILAKYAEAQLSVRPLPRPNIVQAMSAYRRLLRVQPGDAVAFKRLALLYETSGDSGELAQIASNRRAVLPQDPPATIAAARSLAYQQKFDQARPELEALVQQLEVQSEKRPEFVEACILLSDLVVQKSLQLKVAALVI